MICAWCGDRHHWEGGDCPRAIRRSGGRQRVGEGTGYVWIAPPPRAEQYRFTDESGYQKAMREDAESASVNINGPRQVLEAIKNNEKKVQR